MISIIIQCPSLHGADELLYIFCWSWCPIWCSVRLKWLTRFRYGSCADSRASRSGHGSGLGDGPYDEYLCWKALSVCCQFYSKNLWPGKMTLSWNLNTDDHGIILDIDDEYWSIVQYNWLLRLGMGNAVFMHDMFWHFVWCETQGDMTSKAKCFTAWVWCFSYRCE